ncbi:PREDICTED: uncharacterized protein LOC105359998 [Ceratosolen solmsi marchali]|uniref:Uncharacterized protein LOC105359998 n=1 Tax=Ceratosolen solmsi marchali TaxID=326594 RepID=A0AAJ6VKT5_9HYME|nr:PREDICTED: uncharacterized protein LOC105359998 [Ceratosolen solmsi marchali]
MKDVKPTDKLDGTLRIHRRRPGSCQPKDSLGLSCIFQENDLEKDQSLSRRKTLTVPQDNIGISCLPAKEFDCTRNTPLNTTESDDTKKIVQNTDQKKIETEEYLTRLRGGADWTWMLNSEFDNLNPNERKQKHGRNKQLHNTISDIGISNIQRPKGDKLKPRKSILPKDNIGSYCRLLPMKTWKR